MRKQRAKELGPYAGFALVLHAAIIEDFGSQLAFAEALGVSEGQISHYVSGNEATKPESLQSILATLRIPALQEKVHEAWIAEFAPLPEVPEGATSSEIISVSEGFVRVGRTRRAIGLAIKGLSNLSDPLEWQRVAERIVPWRLRVGDISRAWALSDHVEAQARARRDSLGVLSAMAMKGTVLRQIETVTPSAIGKASKGVLDHLDGVASRGDTSREGLLHRRASALREHAVHLLFLVRLRKISREHLRDAKEAVSRSLAMAESKTVLAAGLEVRSRVEYEQGQLATAEETLDSVKKLGHQLAFELWEKTSCTQALILQARGERDEAIATLESVRDASEASEDWHHFRQADQLLAHILAGI